MNKHTVNFDSLTDDIVANLHAFRQQRIESPEGQAVMAGFNETHDTVCVRKELFDWLVHYASELQGVWNWKEGSTARNTEEFERLKRHISEAITRRDSPKS